MFALSYEELSKGTYFADNASRQRITTDYSRANGAWMKETSGEYGIGKWWTRSPRADANNTATIVDFDGSYADNSATVNTGSVGVVPVLWIKLNYNPVP